MLKNLYFIYQENKSVENHKNLSKLINKDNAFAVNFMTGCRDTVDAIIVESEDIEEFLFRVERLEAQNLQQNDFVGMMPTEMIEFTPTEYAEQAYNYKSWWILAEDWTEIRKSMVETGESQLFYVTLHSGLEENYRTSSLSHYPETL